MIVLQAGNLPTWQDDERRMHKLERHNTVKAPWGDRSQKIWWVNNVPYDWYDPETKKWQNTVLHYVQCVETWTDAAGDHQSTWTWVSGNPFTRRNELERCNRMARHRWDIEENILVEKPLGYEYKPLCSGIGMRCRGLIISCTLRISSIFWCSTKPRWGRWSFS